MESNIFQIATPARTGDYIDATRKGFEFGAAERLYNKLVEKQDLFRKKMDGKDNSSFKVVISFLGIFVAIVLGIIEANNIKMTIVAIGNFGDSMAMIIATGFVCMGLIIGEELNAGLVKNEFDNKRKPTGRFWGAVLLGLIYLGIQVSLSLHASADGSADMQSEVIYTVIFSSLICMAEIVFGYIFLRPAITSIAFFILNIRVKYALQKLNGIAKNVEALWQRYLFTIQKAGVQPAEETEAVRKAREFYAQGGYYDLNQAFSN